MSVSSRVPRLPIIEPERVSVPPLAITLSAAYRYRLAGREAIGQRMCYVLAFEPVAGEEPSFAGRAWIDEASFALARMEAVQTGLSGLITSSEQRDEYGTPASRGARRVAARAHEQLSNLSSGGPADAHPSRGRHHVPRGQRTGLRRTASSST